MADLIWWCIVVLVFYTVIPTLLMRIFGIGAYPKSIESGIALTFDDGPDPKYTPILLDLLQKHNVKATFFVLGSKAERSPELILRMHREGHLIGLHNYVHRTNGLMMPWKVRRQLEQAAEAVKKITGESPQYYRPLGHRECVRFFPVQTVPYRPVVAHRRRLAEEDRERQDQETADYPAEHGIGHCAPRQRRNVRSGRGRPRTYAGSAR
ncbi:polysaccharide deacetylase family protein [Paenibacillus sp. P26]|nr:polysaccharide deacetylase family protein [Paenibacillus sp. P26]UUZ90470.1 polysaccharide deacetylase family protein [Paenibacillus sp. P25]